MYLDMSARLALKSTCLRRNFGVVIVKGDTILAQGYGAVPRGTPNCTDAGFCYRARARARMGQYYADCRAVHAEQEAIIHARGRDMIDSTLYLVGLDAATKKRLSDVEPCTICKRLIINAGINRVVVSAGEDASRDYFVKGWIEIESEMAMSPSMVHSESLSTEKRSIPMHTPVLSVTVDSTNLESEGFKDRITTLEAGNKDAKAYQKVVLEILDFLFNPALIDGELEVATVDGTERRDIIFTNDSNEPFWSELRSRHLSPLIMFETKNTTALDSSHFNQMASYLGDRIGTLGFIVTRNSVGKPQQKKAYSIYNDSNPRKMILVLSNPDLLNMLDMKCSGKNPMRHLQKLYRAFLTGVQ